MAELEAVTQTRIIKRFRKLGYKVYRLRATDKPGTPDLLIMKESRAFFIEVKRVGEKPTPLQLHEHADLLKHGFRTEVWDAETLIKNK
jgi:Holliday junction resolvase